MSGVSIQHVDADEEGMRLDRWFKVHYPDLAFGQLQKMLRKGQVRVDGARAKTNTRLEENQAIRVPPMPSNDGPAPVRYRDKDRELLESLILYKDDKVFVLNKPSGLAVQGGSKTERHIDGMLDALQYDMKERPRLVHRLDRDTSGCLLIARTRAAASTLGRTFRTRSARKIYWALVKGVPRPGQGKVSCYLQKFPGPDGERVHVVHQNDQAQHSTSYYSVVDKVGVRFAWLSLKPVTGRTHQLRVHCQHLGHPIIGDPKYFEIQNYELAESLEDKLHLHARRLSIPHPSGVGVLDVTAPLPDHMQASWDALGFSVKEHLNDEDDPEEELS